MTGTTIVSVADVWFISIALAELPPRAANDIFRQGQPDLSNIPWTC